MYDHRFFRFILIIFVMVLPSLIFGGAWVQKKNVYFLRVYSSYLFSSREYNYQGDELDLYEEHLGYADSYFRDISIIIYSEYGLSEHLTFIGELPFKSLTLKRSVAGFYARDEIATNSGFADLYLAGKFKILNDPLAISVQAGTRLPMGYEKQPANNGPRLGSGDVSVEGHVLVGASFYPLPIYFSGSAGYRYRIGVLHDEIIFTGEIGLTLGKFFLKSYAEVLRNVVTPPDIFGQRVVTPLEGGGGVVPDVIIGDQHLTKIIPSVTYQLTDTIGLQAEIIEILGGKNTLSGTTYSFGLVMTN